MVVAVTGRDRLWETAADQHGYVTTAQAANLDVSRAALAMLARRGKLEHAGYGLYRLPQIPVSEYDPFMLAVLRTGAPEACLSHETALACYEISDVNPEKTHVTVSASRRIRRSGGDGYQIHYEDLTLEQVGWWNEVPTVRPAVAIAQCIRGGTPTYLLDQALERGQSHGYLTATQTGELERMLRQRNG